MLLCAVTLIRFLGRDQHALFELASLMDRAYRALQRSTNDIITLRPTRTPLLLHAIQSHRVNRAAYS